MRFLQHAPVQLSEPDAAGVSFISGERASHLALAGDGIDLHFPSVRGLSFSAFASLDAAKAAGLRLNWQANQSLNFGVGVVNESEHLLHTQSGGAFGELSGATFFTGVNGAREFGEWRFDANAELGFATPDADDGILNDFSRLMTSAFAVSLARDVSAARRVTFSLSQPLRIERGDVNVTIPTGREPASGEVKYADFRAALTPSGRQLDWAFALRQQLSRGAVTLSAVWRHEVNHAKDAASDVGVLAEYRFGF